MAGAQRERERGNISLCVYVTNVFYFVGKNSHKSYHLLYSAFLLIDALISKILLFEHCGMVLTISMANFV